jgi:transposase InsO family protein
MPDNGIVERAHKTVLDEFYRVAFRKRIYGSIAELQADVDEWIRSYNEDRLHISAQTACDFGLIRPPVSGQFAQRFRRFRHPFRSNPPQLWVEGRGV